MILELKAKHFNGTEYHSSDCGCAIEKAAKDQFKAKDARDLVDILMIDGAHYRHPEYHPSTFNKDKIKADELNYSDAVIRKMHLIKLKS